jgi:uncharacterized membrane protein
MDATWVAMTWLHAVGMVVLLGYYTILGLVILPGLARALDGASLGSAIAAVGRRSRPLVLLAIAAFLVSGIYLMVTAGRYSGLGNLFASTWTTLITIKHLLVLIMLAVAVGVDQLSVAVGHAGSDEARRTDVGLLGLAAQVMVALGAVVLLLTAAAQAN